MKKALILTFALVFLFATQAFALQMDFFGEDLGLGDHNGKLSTHPNADAAQYDFLSYLSGVGTEDFETLTLWDSTPTTLVFSGAGTATLTGSGEVDDERYNLYDRTMTETDNEWFGRFAISGTQYFGQVSAPGFNIALSDPVAAFGFYGVDIGDFAGQLVLEFANGSTDTINFPNTITTGGSVFYYGYINTDNPFVNVAFTTTSSSDAFGFDDLTIGSVAQVQVPDLSAVFLLGSACLIGCAGLRRKYKL